MIRMLGMNELVSHFARGDYEKKLFGFPFAFPRAHWVFEEGGSRLGRISANISIKDPKIGYIGFFDCDVSAPNAASHALQLIQGAVDWLRDQGVEMAYGPVNYHTLFDYRLRLPDPGQTGEAVPEFFWEPNQPLGYVEWWSRAGFQLVEEYHSRAYRHLDRILPKSQERYNQARALGFSVRTLDFKQHRERDLKALTRINAGSFEQSFLAEPFDDRAYRELVAPRFASLLSEFSFFLIHPSGEEIGYFFLFPESDYLVWKTLAVLPEFQGTGLAAFGIHHALTLAAHHGIEQVVSALIRNGAQSEHLLKRAEAYQVWEHRYGVFGKQLTTNR